MNAIEYAKNISEYLIRQRRHFHQNPEVSWQEYKTSKHIQSELDKMGIPYVVIDDLGIIATLRGQKASPVIGLRCDMDALPVTEKTGLPFASQNERVMHACGHDSHMAMLLGAAKILSENKAAVSGTVKFIFQPAEESLAGALSILKSPEVNDIDNYMSIHNLSTFPAGKISVQEGPRMSSCGIFKIKVIGKGGHGAFPSLSIDPIVAACALVGNLQSIVSRELDPVECGVVSVCSFNAGNRFNITPEYAELSGTTRGYDKEFLAKLPGIMERVIKHTCEVYRTTYEFNYEQSAPAVFNDPSSSAKARNAVIKILGEDALYDYPKTTGAEDFAFYLQDKPGHLAYVGSGRIDEPVHPFHNPKFDIDERCLVIGAALYAQYALENMDG